MYIENQRVPFLSGQVSTAASTFEFLLKARTPTEESAGVPRVAKNTCNSVVLQIAPADRSPHLCPPSHGVEAACFFSAYPDMAVEMAASESPTTIIEDGFDLLSTQGISQTPLWSREGSRRR
jgi:hypothetical protein